jgi:hypothetical protein
MLWEGTVYLPRCLKQFWDLASAQAPSVTCYDMKLTTRRSAKSIQ